MVFRIAGIYGLIVVTPLYFLEKQYGIDHPPPVVHPEFYYGFVGLCLVFQLLFLLIATDPVRFRPIMLIGIAEKLCFVIPCVILAAQQRIPGLTIFFSVLDLGWAGLFFASYLKTPRAADRT
jgi:hypothetical protein